LFDDGKFLVAQVDDQIVQTLLERIWALTKMCWVVTKKTFIIGSMAIVNQTTKKFRAIHKKFFLGGPKTFNCQLW
jgi:hypothetical protein